MPDMFYYKKHLDECKNRKISTEKSGENGKFQDNSDDERPACVNSDFNFLNPELLDIDINDCRKECEKIEAKYVELFLFSPSHILGPLLN